MPALTIRTGLIAVSLATLALSGGVGYVAMAIAETLRTQVERLMAERDTMRRQLDAGGKKGGAAGARGGALATRLVGLDATALASLDQLGNDGQAPSVVWRERFEAWNKTWINRGLTALFAALEGPEIGITRRLALVPLTGERRATNYRHLTDLLLEAAREAAPACQRERAASSGGQRARRPLMKMRRGQRASSDAVVVFLMLVAWPGLST